MDDPKEFSFHMNSLQLSEDISKTSSYNHFYKDVQRLTASPSVKVDNFHDTLTKQIKSSGLETRLRNNVYHWMKFKKREMENNGANDQTYLRKAQVQWDKRIHKSLQSMCSELGINLAKVRANPDREDLLEKWGELSTYDVDVHQYRPVYSPKDFLEVILALRPSHKKKPGQPKWEFSHLPIKVKTLETLRELYIDLAKGASLLGVNPHVVSSVHYPTLEAERIALGHKVLTTYQAPIAQEYLKKGSPICFRAQLWTLVLGSEVKEKEYNWYGKLKESVLQYDLMIDKLIIKDIHLTAANDDQYFVFEDVLFQILLCFSRDNEIISQLTQKTQMQVAIKGRQAGSEATIIFPPSGVIPFHGFTMYAAPFCYLYEEPIKLYYTFRAFYIRYWYRLHRVCNHSEGIVSLCLLYERLLQCHEPNLWLHFKNHNIHPIRIVFKWLMRAFSGHLPPEQLLFLWDLILAYDSLEILPLLAVCIISLRKENLIQVSTLMNIEAVLADLSSVVVMPLLQIALLRDDTKNLINLNSRN